MKKRNAFTLAEVLITLGIIGIVAAMTIPNLIYNFQERVLLIQIRKTYNNLMQAIELFKAKNETEDLSNLFSGTNTSRQTRDELAKYFKDAKVCNAGDYKCYPKYDIKKTTGRYDDNGDPLYNNIGSQETIHLGDGSIISIIQYNSCERIIEGSPIYDEDKNIIGKEPDRTDNSCAQISFDVNGKKGPNVTGKDFFCLAVSKKNIIFYNSVNCGDLKSILYEDKLNETVNY